MKYMNKSIEELHELLKNGEVTSKELIEESLKLSHEVEEKYNAFVTILDDAKEVEVTDSLLSGIPCGVKDNYSTRGILSTGSSNTLKDYADKLLIGLTKEETKMVLDEFEIIDETINKINDIKDIEKVEPMTHALDDFEYELRDDDEDGSVPIEELLQNCDEFSGREVEVPKVVG